AGALLWLLLPGLVRQGPPAAAGAQRLDASDALFAAIALASGGAGAGVLVFAWWIDRRLFRPLGRLIAGAGELAGGQARRVEEADAEELAVLSRALNYLAETAETQFAAV